MIEKVVNKGEVDSYSEIQANLAYWLARPAHERIEAVEVLRKQHDGTSQRLKKVVRVHGRQRDINRCRHEASAL